MRGQPEETLRALAVQPHIVSACLFDRHGRPFASYARSELLRRLSRKQPRCRRGEYFQARALDLYSLVRFDHESIGTLYLRSDLTQAYSRLRSYGAMLGLALLASCLIAYLLASRLERVISGPIGELAEAARGISSNRNFSIPAR